MRPTEVHLLLLSQVRRKKPGNKYVFVISVIIGSTLDEPKNIKAGWNAVKLNPKEITVFGNYEISELLNIYKDIDEYLSVRENIIMRDDNKRRFSAAINGKAASFSNSVK